MSQRLGDNQLINCQTYAAYILLDYQEYISKLCDGGIQRKIAISCQMHHYLECTWLHVLQNAPLPVVYMATYSVKCTTTFSVYGYIFCTMQCCNLSNCALCSSIPPAHMGLLLLFVGCVANADSVANADTVASVWCLQHLVIELPLADNTTMHQFLHYNSAKAKNLPFCNFGKKANI